MSDKKLSEAKQFLYNNTTSKIHKFNKESVEAMASFMVAFSKKENEQLQKLKEKYAIALGFGELANKQEKELQKLKERIKYLEGFEEDLWIGLDGTKDHPCWRLYLNGDDLGCYPDEELLSEVKMLTRELLKKRK